MLLLFVLYVRRPPTYAGGVLRGLRFIHAVGVKVLFYFNFISVLAVVEAVALAHGHVVFSVKVIVYDAFVDVALLVVSEIYEMYG